MIAKRVSRTRTRDSFKRLGLYIMGETEKAPAGNGAGGTWQRTAAYVLDLSGSGGRVGQIRICNCEATEPADAIAEIQAVQAMNWRAKGDKTYHLVVSFPPGEKPSEAQLCDIEDELCAAIGLADHQRISAVHTDTDHLHIHIAINKVHAVTRRCVEPYYDKHKLMAACDRLEIKHGLERTRHGKSQEDKMRGRGADMEAHSGQEALSSWIRTHSLADIQACLRGGQNWQDLHAVLATYDLEIRPRGAGLVLATADGTVMVRASRFSRALSMAALTKRWGAYAPVVGPKPAAKLRYQREPKRKSVSSASLWAEYQNQRQAAKAARALAIEQLCADAARQWQSIADWKDARAKSVQDSTHFTAQGRAYLWSVYRLDVAVKEREFAEWQRDQRAMIYGRHPLPTWFGFLQDNAAGGNIEALDILRDREARQRQAAAAFAATADESEAKSVVFSALRPVARKNGQMVYRLRDGGRVIDGGDAISVEVVTPHALFLALSLLAERSPGKAVALGGDDAFQQQMVAMAASKKMDLSFAAPQHERRRRELMGLPQRPEPVPPGLVMRLGQMLTAGFGARRL
jgi:hypothetical protein